MLLKEENVPRNSWPFERITNTYPGDDGLVRSVNVIVANKAASGKTKTIKRPISKLILLCESPGSSHTEEASSIISN